MFTISSNIGRLLGLGLIFGDFENPNSERWSLIGRSSDQPESHVSYI